MQNSKYVREFFDLLVLEGTHTELLNCLNPANRTPIYSTAGSKDQSCATFHGSHYTSLPSHLKRLNRYSTVKSVDSVIWNKEHPYISPVGTKTKSHKFLSAHESGLHGGPQCRLQRRVAPATWENTPWICISGTCKGK